VKIFKSLKEPFYDEKFKLIFHRLKNSENQKVFDNKFSQNIESSSPSSLFTSKINLFKFHSQLNFTVRSGRTNKFKDDLFYFYYFVLLSIDCFK
jgi:hypothetical protein